MKGMVKGQIQTIPQCIFDKISFPTYDLAKIQNDAETDNYSLIYDPVLSLSHSDLWSDPNGGSEPGSGRETIYWDSLPVFFSQS